MSKYIREKDEKEQSERNIFRCALISIFSALTNALDGIERVFIHKALQSPQLYIS